MGRSLEYWKNTETVFVDALAVTDRNVKAHNSLGAYYLEIPGQLPDAIDHVQKAVEIDPKNDTARNDLGLALLRTPDRQSEARA